MPDTGQTPFDAAACGQAVGDVVELSAELMFVDWVIANLDGQADDSAGPIEGMVERAERVTFGTTYPVTLEYNVFVENQAGLDRHREQRDETIASLRGRADDWAEGRRRLWLDMLDPVWRGPTAPYDACLASITSGWDAVRNSVTADWSGLDASNERWVGAAGAAFTSHFLNTTSQVHVNHGWALDTVAGLVEVSRDIHELGQWSVMNTFVPARALLRKQLQHRQESRRPTSDASSFLALTSAALGLASIVTAPVPVLAGTLAAISTGTGYASGVVAEEEHEVIDVEVTYAWELAGTIEETIDTINAHVGSRYDALEGEVDRLQRLVDETLVGIGGRNTFVVARPAFVDDPDPSESFYHSSSSQSG